MARSPSECAWRLAILSACAVGPCRRPVPSVADQARRGGAWVTRPCAAAVSCCGRANGRPCASGSAARPNRIRRMPTACLSVPSACACAVSAPAVRAACVRACGVVHAPCSHPDARGLVGPSQNRPNPFIADRPQMPIDPPTAFVVRYGVPCHGRACCCGASCGAVYPSRQSFALLCFVVCLFVCLFDRRIGRRGTLAAGCVLALVTSSLGLLLTSRTHDVR